MLKEKAVSLLAQAEEWNLFGRNFSTPNYIIISLRKSAAAEGEFAEADKVFEAMGLDLEKLSQIFVKEPWVYYATGKEHRQKQPTAQSYQVLKICRALDEEGWQALAMLTKKKINFIYCHGEPEGDLRAIYYPDGKIERVNPYT